MLHHLFKAAHSEDAFDALLELTFTEKERAMMLERWKIFDAVDRGLTQRKIADEVPCSIVTATRGVRVYNAHKALVRQYLEVLRKQGVL
jgi:Trp operon repressor